MDLFNSLDEKDNNITNTYNTNMFNIDDQISDFLIHQNILNSRNSFNQLMYDLAIKGQNKDENAYEFSYIMMFKEVPLYNCFDGVPGRERFITLKESYVYMYYIIEQTAANEVNEGKWFRSDEICEIFGNQPGLESSTLQLFLSLMQEEVNQCDKENEIIDLYSLIFPFLPFVFFFLPVAILTKLFINDANKIINILLSVNQESKEIAQKPILKNSSLEIIQPSEKKPKKIQWILLNVIVFISSAVSAIIIYFMLEETDELNANVKKLGRWNLLASIRMANSIEVMSYLLTAVILNGSSTLNISSSPRVVSKREYMINLAKKSIIKLTDSNEA